LPPNSPAGSSPTIRPGASSTAAKTFRRTDGDLREVMRTIPTSPELWRSPPREKMKSPFEYIASALRVTDAEIKTTAPFVGAIAGMGEPSYQSQPPTGYAEQSSAWINTGALVNRLNFAQRLGANGLGASTIDPARAEAALKRVRPDVASDQRAPAIRLALLIGSPGFQTR
jgi:uncharacterized protein (DUF1800 family)